MWTPVLLIAALALGQPGVDSQDAAPTIAPPPAPGALYIQPAWSATAPEPPAPPAAAPEPFNVPAMVLPAPTPPAAAAAAAPAAAPPPRWLLMKELQGTYAGGLLDGNNINLYGWVEGSGTLSTSGITNEPMAWNDRSNRFLLQQMFIRMERTVVTTGTTEPTWGFRTDWIVGSDYRFTLPRGMWNGQLINSDPTQNLYGVDPVEFYGEYYIPNVQQGLDIKVGRFYTPFGEESVEAVSTPLVSRSYTFNSGPPFSHIGALATLTVNPVWTVAGGIVDGNDIVFDDGQEPRFVGFVKWTQPGSAATPPYGRNTVTLGATLGRGKFNPNAKFAEEEVANGATVTTSGIGGETVGRNNINVVDLLHTHTFNPVLSYAGEYLYGWQTGIGYDTGILVARTGLVGDGTAHWASTAQYLIYTVSPRAVATLRGELFDDYEGSRTGFKGLYTEVTGGLAFKLRPGLIVRPELRYDWNGQARPFNAGVDPSHDQFTAACDVILRW